MPKPAQPSSVTSLHALTADPLFQQLPAEARRGLAAKAEPDLATLAPEAQDEFINRVANSDPFDAAERRYNLPTGLLRAIQGVETGGQPDPTTAVSPTGVRGLMQITRRTGAPYGLSAQNWSNPVLQIDVAGQIMRDNLAQHKGVLERAIAQYGDPKDTGYAAKVMSRMAKEAPAPERREVVNLGGGNVAWVPPGTPRIGKQSEIGRRLVERIPEEAASTVGATALALAAGAALGPEAAIAVRAGTEVAAGIIGGLLGRSGIRQATGRGPIVPTLKDVTEEAITNVIPIVGGHVLRAGIALTQPEAKVLFSEVAPALKRGVDAERTGLQMMRAADEALGSVERIEARKYGVARRIAERGGLSGPFPRELANPARDALTDISALGLTPSQQVRATTTLRKIVNYVDGTPTKPGPTTLSYVEADNLRRELQPFVTKFERRGAGPVSREQSALDQTYHYIKRHMRSLARGSRVSDALDAADEFFITQVKPARAARTKIAKGQVESQAIVDTMTSPAHERKFRVFMDRAWRNDPALAQRVVQTKFQRMIADASDEVSGTFDVGRFRNSWSNMPPQTQRLLTRSPSELTEFLGNLDRATRKAKRLPAVGRVVVAGVAVQRLSSGIKDIIDGDLEAGFSKVLQAGGGYWLARHMADPLALKWTNRAFAAAASGASPHVVKRAAQLGAWRTSYAVVEEALRNPESPEAPAQPEVPTATVP